VSFGRYLLGLALLAAVVGAAGLAGVAVRRRWLALWSGAAARLAESVVALTIVLAVAEALGTVGLLRTGWFTAGAVALGLGLAGGLRARTGGAPARPEAAPAVAAAVAVAALVLVLAQWAATLSVTLHGGMTGPDTLAYHGPIAATFVQRASIVHPPFINTDPTIAFFPATSELIDAIGILLFSRDVLTPFINLGWLAFAGLAAWCVGRPRGLGPASLLVGLIVLDVPAFSTSQPSSGDNDVMALALLFASLALLFTPTAAGDASDRTVSDSPAAIGLAAAAAGFSLATKVTMFAPVGLLAIVGLVALRGMRNRVVWLLGVLLTCGVWFVRNLFAFGNPVPAVRLGAGPVALPSAHVPTGASVAGSITSLHFWRTLLLPGLHAGFTWMWPLLLGAALFGAVAAVARGHSRLDRLLGLAALLSGVAYAVTPRTGFVFLIAINLRYLGPAVVFGVALLFRMPGSRRLRAPWTLAPLVAGVVVELADRAEKERIGGFPQLSPTPHFASTSAMWIGIGLAILVAGVVLARTATSAGRWSGWSGRSSSWCSRPTLPILALSAFVVLGLALWPAEHTYLRTRYTTGPLAFARPLRHQRIAVVGYEQDYPAFGLDLTNSVTEISHHGAHGAQTEIESCRAWRRTLNAGHYGYVVTSPPYGLVFPSAPDYAAWTRSDPAATVIGTFPDGIGGVITDFRLTGRLNPDGCE
jgi:hypothetical protein